MGVAVWWVPIFNAVLLFAVLMHFVTFGFKMCTVTIGVWIGSNTTLGQHLASKSIVEQSADNSSVVSNASVLEIEIFMLPYHPLGH